MNILKMELRKQFIYNSIKQNKLYKQIKQKAVKNPQENIVE